MGHKACMVIFIVFVIGLLSFFSSISADDTASVEINIIGEKTQTRFDKPVIVAGIWHHINITLENQDFQKLSLKFYNGDSMPNEGERNATNYYEWKYDENIQASWKDEMEYEGRPYLNSENCRKNKDVYSFCVGIKDTFPPEIPYYYENWTLEVYKEENKLFSKSVVVEKPTVGLAKSHADLIKFNVVPFTETVVFGDDSFKIENTGNIPLNISIDYEADDDIIEVADSNIILSPYSGSLHNVTLHSKSWKPGIIEIEGTISGKIPGSYIVTTANFTLTSALGTSPAYLKIFVGQNNYEIYEMPEGIVFQYEKNLEMNEGEIRDIAVYISGGGVATLDIWSDEKNITILKISSKNQEGTPQNIISTDTSEYVVTVKIEAIRENKIGFIYYALETGGENQTFITQINVGPPSSGEQTSNTVPTMAIIVIVCIFLVIGYMLYTHMKHRRR